MDGFLFQRMSKAQQKAKFKDQKTNDEIQWIR